MEQIQCEQEQKADDYRNQNTTWIMQQNLRKSSKSKNLFPKPVKITQCNGGVGVSCFDSSIWQGHILDLLDLSCKTTIKRKFSISRKRKLPFPHLFRRKTSFHFCFHFRQKNSVSVSVPQISVFIFSFCFRFSAKKSESFRSTFIPTRKYDVHVTDMLKCRSQKIHWCKLIYLRCPCEHGVDRARVGGVD
jgi:hypothetical protein